MHLPKRLNTRIVLVVSCVLLVTGIASGWLSASERASSLLCVMRENSTVIARNLAEGVAREMLTEDYATLEAFLLKSSQLPDVRRLQVAERNGALVWDIERDVDGVPTARTGVATIALPKDTTAHIDIDGEMLVVWQPVEAGSLLGWLKAEFSLAGIRAAQAAAWKASLLLALAWVAGSALLIILILRPIVDSIARLTAFASQLSARTGEQVALPGQPAEIEQLAASLNEASTKLADAERQLLAERERLRQSEEKYRTIFEESFDGLFLTTPAGKIVEMNKKGVAMFGYAHKDEMAALDLARDVYVHAPDRERILAMVNSVGTAEYEVEVRRKDGETFIAHCALTAVRGDDGEVTTYRGIIRDVTQAKKAEAEIRSLNQELERRVADRTAQLESANKELEAFSYSVSHDLRAPLRHIEGFIRILQEDLATTLGDEDRHYMEIITRAARQMEMLIDDLLAFSRIGRSELRKAPFDLRVLVDEIIQEAAPEIGSRNVQWRIASLPQVTADRAMLRVAMSNLILNALKFTRRRDPAEIEIGCEPGANGETTIFVRDNGAGFDMAYGDKLFGVFQRLHPADQFEGTGIGLANVRRVISRHGGRTWAEGRVDAGATFYFSLPPQEGDEHRAGEGVAPSESAALH